eukprot:12890275-Prorocentrum_lima.AAC.1
MGTQAAAESQSMRAMSPCQHKHQDGTVCGAPLDGTGEHQVKYNQGVNDLDKVVAGRKEAACLGGCGGDVGRGGD